MKSLIFSTSILLVCLLFASPVLGQNRLAHLDEFCNPYHVDGDFPKLITPQWVGEDGVDAVIVLSIDDMRGYQKWESYLRPIVDRLKEIDGRAPVSIMTCKINPQEPHLQAWKKEGLSLEVHTIDHPCPCLQRGDFAKASGTYHDCVDLMASIPGNEPVAFRMPCCDSQNTPSPRFFTEVFDRPSKAGNFLRIDSSVFNVATPADKSLPRELVADAEGNARFRKYLPFPSYVNTIENYPYPYVIGRKCWQFPCVVPSDWEAQNIQKPSNPATVTDLKTALDITVIKKGVFTFVFHPYGWIRNDQVVELIDYANKKYGKRVKFLNFKECADRLAKNALASNPLRNAKGDDNGVRVLDVNHDGFLDCVIGNERTKVTRVWSPKLNKWKEFGFPTMVSVNGNDAGVRFGELQQNQHASLFVKNDTTAGCWHFADTGWKEDQRFLTGLEILDRKVFTSRGGIDQGVRLRDLNNDGRSELIAGGPAWQAIFQWNDSSATWNSLPFGLPANTFLVDAKGNDAGLRFVDINEDNKQDVIFSNGQLWSAHLFSDMKSGWLNGIAAKRPDDGFIPPIVRGETNNGAWFHSQKMWVQNEDTSRLPDGVDRISLVELAQRIAKESDNEQGKNAALPQPTSPEDALETFQTKPGLEVQLVASEPLLQDPIAFDWGADGSLWVVEMGDYPKGEDGAEGKPGGRVKRLVDTNNDGRYDESTIFLDGLSFPTGIKVWRDGVIVAAAPRILFARDTNDDGKAEEVLTLFDGFGEGNQQHRVNGLRFGLDNWLYLANGDSGGKVHSLKTGERLNLGRRDLRINPDTGEVQPASGTTQFGRSRDDWGNWFGGNNSNPIWHYALQEQYLARNPHFSPPIAKRQISATPGTARVFPVSRTLERFNNPHSANRFTSACSPDFYRDNALGKTYTGNTFICEPVHNLVHREVVSTTGGGFRTQRADDEQSSEFLASTDSWFRPTMVRTGPDGALWVADMYRLVIEHPEWIPKRFQDTYDLQAGSDRGRIYRIVPRGKSLPMPHFQNDDTPSLVARLSSSNGAIRDMAQQLILWRSDKEAAALLKQVVVDSKSPVGRLHALCTLDGLNALDVATAKIALSDEHAAVRRHAVRCCESLVNEHEELASVLASLVADRDAMVRKQLGYSVGEWGDATTAGRIIAEIISRDSADLYEVAAAMSSLNERNVGFVLTALLKQKEARPESIALLLEQAVAMGATKSLAPAIELLTTPDDAGQFALWQFESASRLQLLANENRSLEEAISNAKQRFGNMFSHAREVASNRKSPIEQRLAAIQLLGAAPTDSQFSRDELLAFIAPTADTSIQLAAIASIRDHQTLKVLLGKWDEFTPAIRSRVFDVLVSRRSNVAVLVEAMQSKTIDLRTLNATQRSSLLQHADEQVRTLAGKWSQPTTTSARAELIARYAKAMPTKTDKSNGAKLFAKHCAACHKLGTTGTHVGPDLAALSNRSPLHLLTAILDPNRAVEDKFLSYQALTEDGQVYSGMLEAEVGSSVTLRTAQGKSIQLLRNQLDEFRSTGNSLMPEGFELDIKPHEVADLIAFVGSSGAPPKSFPGNKPAIVSPDTAGVFHLYATTASIYGSHMKFEQKYKNIGWWQANDDHAVWKVTAATPQEYLVAINYASPNDSAGNTFSVSVGDKKLKHQVVGTNSWDRYQWRDIGRIRIASESTEVLIRSQGEPTGPVLDLKEIRLTPVGD